MYVDGCNPEPLEGAVFTFMEDWLRKQLQHTGEDLAAQYVEQIRVRPKSGIRGHRIGGPIVWSTTIGWISAGLREA